MANTLLSPDWVTFEVARGFVNSLRGVGQFNRQYKSDFKADGAKVGDTVKIRLPHQWAASEGEAADYQNILDRSVSLILNRRRHIAFSYSTAEDTLEIEAFRERYVRPAAETLASIYDRLALADVYKDVYNALGTLGTTPNSALTYLQSVVKILDGAGPDEGLVAVLDPLANATIANQTTTLFHPGGKVAENWSKGQFAAEQLGISRWFNDQNAPRFTSGACTSASTPLVNGASQTGSSIVTDGWGSGACSLKKGDIVTFAGVRQVNPLSKESTGRLMQFTLTADVSDSSGAITLSISPSIITTGALQNVDAAPADNATITYWGMAAGGTQAATVSPQNLVFHPDAFATVMVDLAMPEGGATASRVNSTQLNMAMRYVRQYSIDSDQNKGRLDMLFGSVAVQPRLACRVVG